MKQPILLPKLVRDYLFVTLATPSSCFTFSALGALLREGEKAVIDRATQVAKMKTRSLKDDTEQRSAVLNVTSPSGIQVSWTFMIIRSVIARNV